MNVNVHWSSKCRNSNENRPFGPFFHYLVPVKKRRESLDYFLLYLNLVCRGQLLYLMDPSRCLLFDSFTICKRAPLITATAIIVIGHSATRIFLTRVRFFAQDALSNFQNETDLWIHIDQYNDPFNKDGDATDIVLCAFVVETITSFDPKSRIRNETHHEEQGAQTDQLNIVLDSSISSTSTENDPDESQDDDYLLFEPSDGSPRTCSSHTRPRNAESTSPIVSPKAASAANTMMSTSWIIRNMRETRIAARRR